MIILALLVVLFFSLSSISAQSVNNSDDFENKILKSDSSSNKAATLNTTSKAKTNSTKKTNANKTSTNKTSTTKAKANTTTVNRKTLAKTSTSFINYVEKNGKFPKVKISNKNYSNTEYLYLMTKAVENNSNSKIVINRNLVKKYSNKNSKSVKGTLNKTEYVKIASKTRKFIDKNRRAPNWVSSSKGNIPYNQLILSYSKCMDFFNKNNRLPNSIKLDDLDLDKINSKIKKSNAKSTVNSSAKSSNKTVNKTKANAVKTNASKTANKTTASTAKTTNKTKNTTDSSSKNDDNSVKDSSLVEMTLNNIHSILNNILDKLDPSKYKVDLTKSDEANLKLNTSKINVDINGKSTVNVKVSTKNTTKATKATTKKTTASTKKTNQTKASVSKTATKKVSSSKSSVSEALRKYLASTKNCQVKNKEIQDLAKTLTSKLKSDYEKGKKLFNWVRDNIHYKKYRNTLRGAVKTLKAKKGNCVDQSHLLIALSRASGIPARYVKGGDCKFTSGYVSGHIWTQLYINKKWVVADTTSPRNTLGKIRNWNTKNYKLDGQFSSISF
ncbi:MAG: transglutaminase domain-containing protein [Methanobrevibacter sp.]|nr:transglutaminase domain-containing protein [Methanobrevibacter sp.]